MWNSEDTEVLVNSLVSMAQGLGSSLRDTDHLRARIEHHVRPVCHRLQQAQLCNKEWLDKTEWVQSSAKGKELGLHRADVLRQRIEDLQAVNSALNTAVANLKAAQTKQQEVGQVVLTTTEDGELVAVTRQDAEGRILKTLWMKK